MTDFPKTISIGPYVYAVTDNKDTFNEVVAKWGGCVGYVDHDALLIVLAPEPAQAQKRDTLWHECKHAAWRITGAHPNRKLSEEEVISRSSTIELDILRRNPGLVEYL